MSSNNGKTVVIADYDFGDVAIERAIIEGAGLTLTAAHCKTEDEVIDVARDADAIVAQYATVGAKAIGAFTRCEVIARYGTGVDIVDVDAATRRGILVTNVPSDWCENEVADHAMAFFRYRLSITGSPRGRARPGDRNRPADRTTRRPRLRRRAQAAPPGRGPVPGALVRHHEEAVDDRQDGNGVREAAVPVRALGQADPA